MGRSEMRALLEWCEANEGESLIGVAEILEAHPEALDGLGLLKLLWVAATDDQGAEPNQSEENVEQFYRRFPCLPSLRPLMACREGDCAHYMGGTVGFPLMSYLGLIRHMADCHGHTPAQIAAGLRHAFAQTQEYKRQRAERAELGGAS